MTAAVKTATAVGATIGAGAAVNTTGVVEGIYTVSIATTLDWVVFSDFSEIKWVKAYTTATGVEGTAYVSTTSTNEVFITTTGATTVLVKGIKA